jgi:hypothetical protein
MICDCKENPVTVQHTCQCKHVAILTLTSTTGACRQIVGGVVRNIVPMLRCLPHPALENHCRSANLSNDRLLWSTVAMLSLRSAKKDLRNVFDYLFFPVQQWRHQTIRTGCHPLHKHNNTKCRRGISTRNNNNNNKHNNHNNNSSTNSNSST